MSIRLISQVYVDQRPIFYGPQICFLNLKTVYSRKVVLGMIDQCHSETDIVNYILPYIIVINFKIIYNKEMAPAGGIRYPLGTCSSSLLLNRNAN